ncbi:MAG: ArsR/SmtB family transcription factor [Planctomycetota bacterium]
MLDAPERLFKLLADETRLRIIRALLEAPLTVGEIGRTLALAQSTTSRHLAAMRAGGLVSDRREGAFAWYSLADALLRDEALVTVVRDAASRAAHAKADARRLEKALERRRTKSRDFFDSVAGSYHEIARPGGGAEGLVSAMVLALGPTAVVDVGCGEGDVALRLARLGHRVHAVDSSRAMIAALRKRLRREGDAGSRVETHVGDIERLPLADGLADVVLMSQILHHAPRPEAALKEAARVARPGGRVVVLDLLRHEQEWTRDRMGDLWLGFDLDELETLMRSVRLAGVRSETIAVEGGLPLVACGGTKRGGA